MRPVRAPCWLGYRGRRAVRPPVEPRRAEDMLQAPSLRVTGGFYGLQGSCRRQSVRSARYRCGVRLAYAYARTVGYADAAHANVGTHSHAYAAADGNAYIDTATNGDVHSNVGTNRNLDSNASPDRNSSAQANGDSNDCARL